MTECVTALMLTTVFDVAAAARMRVLSALTEMPSVERPTGMRVP